MCVCGVEAEIHWLADGMCLVLKDAKHGWKSLRYLWHTSMKQLRMTISYWHWLSNPARYIRFTVFIRLGAFRCLTDVPLLAGIMAILFCGIVMSHYTHFNLSPVTQITMQQTMRTLAFVAGKKLRACGFLGL